MIFRVQILFFKLDTMVHVEIFTWKKPINAARDMVGKIFWVERSEMRENNDNSYDEYDQPIT